MDFIDCGWSVFDASALWLRTFLHLPEGIPPHDTFNRVFSALDPKELEQSFIEWTRSVANLTKKDITDSF